MSYQEAEGSLIFLYGKFRSSSSRSSSSSVFGVGETWGIETFAGVVSWGMKTAAGGKEWFAGRLSDVLLGCRTRVPFLLSM